MEIIKYILISYLSIGLITYGLVLTGERILRGRNTKKVILAALIWIVLWPEIWREYFKNE